MRHESVAGGGYNIDSYFSGASPVTPFPPITAAIASLRPRLPPPVPVSIYVDETTELELELLRANKLLGRRRRVRDLVHGRGWEPVPLPGAKHRAVRRRHFERGETVPYFALSFFLRRFISFSFSTGPVVFLSSAPSRSLSLSPPQLTC